MMSGQSKRRIQIEAPTIIKHISRVLERYPDGGQILKELIQNADDAGATEVMFCLDSRQHPRDNLIHPEMGIFQGPALLAYNNAVFQDKDWDHFGKIGDSCKEKDALKVGRFGVGFLSVFHMTDFPMVISTDTAAMLDPHRRFTGTDNMGWDGKLVDFLSHPGHASCFDKFDGLMPGTHHYNGTLFRFPLRTHESKSQIAKDNYPQDRVCNSLYRSFFSEAHLILLFLKSLVKITLYDNENLVYSISIDQSQIASVSSERKALISIAEDSSRPHLLRVYSMSLNVNESSYHWLIMNSIGSTDDDVKKLSQEQDIIPWVGIAAPLPQQVNLGNITVVDPCNIPNAVNQLMLNCQLKSISFPWCNKDQDHMKGQIFCFLPLPNITHLPVNIHGYFAVSDNRRSIEWPAEDNLSPKALWNKALLDKQVASLYSILLACRAQLVSYNNTPLPVMSSQGSVTDPYSAWPLMLSVKDVWKDFIQSVINGIIINDIPIMWSPAKNGIWVSPSEALYLGRDVPNAVIELLVSGNYPVVSLPVKIRETIEYNHKDLITARTITPAIVRKAVKSLCSLISELKEITALIILDYVLSDIDELNYSELFGIKLLPLATMEFQMVEFKNVQKIPDDSLFVVDLKSSSVLDFLHGIDHSIVSTKVSSNVLEKLMFLAQKKYFQLQLLSCDVISSYLLPKSMMTWYSSFSYHQPLQWHPGIDGQPPSDWIIKVWAWIIKNSVVVDSLKAKGLPILPMEECTSMVDSVTLLPLPVKNEFSYFIKKRDKDDSIMSGLLHKLGATVLSYNSFIFDFRQSINIQIINVETILKYIENKNKVALTDLNDEDKCLLRTAIVHYYCSRNCSFIKLIKQLPIFEVGVGANDKKFVSLSTSHILPSHVISFDTSLHYPPNILNNSDMMVVRFLKEYIGFRCLDNNQLCKKHVLPFALNEIKSSSVWCNGDELFLWAAENSKGSVTLNLKDESFIRTKANPAVCKKASELYDISDDQFNKLFDSKNDPVFPCEKYQEKDVIPVLHSLGLITWKSLMHNKQLLFTFIEERAQVIHTLPFDIALERSQYIMELINSNSSSFATKIMKQLKFIPFLSIQETKPKGYPSSLKWAGETQRNKFECPQNIYHSQANPRLIGSVSPMLADTYVLPHSVCNCFKQITINDVLSQLHTLVNDVQQPASCELNKISDVVYSIYKYVDDSSSSNNYVHDKLPTSWVWWSEDGHQYAFLPLTKFVWSCELLLSPYVYSLTSDLEVKMHSFKDLFRIAGIRKTLSLSEIASILQKIASDYPQAVPEKHIKMAISITMYLAEQKYESKGDIYLPTKDSQLCLTSVCTYDDREWIKQKIGAGISKYKFVHEDIPAKVAHYFGVEPLSMKVAPSQKLVFKQIGPKEKVTRRIKGIVDDYSGNIDVFKELIQNADDAKATEIKLLIDWRKHNTDTLLDENMKHWQGPAIVAYNNAKFSDQDFKNICELAAETKLKDPLKTGRFGVGFCACYSLTDVPIFLSRNYLTIFDPHTKYLNERVSHNEPGMRINLVDSKDDLRVYEDQFAPFDGLFGCDIFNLNGDGYNGTIFRFPLRMPHFPSSEISHKDYTGHTINDLLSELKSEAPRLLLFLKHIQSLQVYVLKNDAKNPSEMVLQFQVQKQLNDVSSRFQIIQNPQPSSSNCSSFTIKVFDNAKESTAHYLISSYVSDSNTRVHVGLISLAELVLKLSENEVPDPISDGYLFCFLPLPIKSELPFHVNGFFDVGKDRRGLKEAVNSPEYAWNESLIVKALPIAFINALARLCMQLRLNLSHMTDGTKEDCLRRYYALWPGAYGSLVDTSGRHIHSWVSSVFADAVKQLLISSNDDIIWSDVHGGKWVSPQDVYLFSDSVPVEIKKEAIDILLSKDYSIAECPHHVSALLNERKDKNKLFTYKRFFEEIFIPNIKEIDSAIRNRQLLFVLGKVQEGRQGKYKWVKEALMSCACIPVAGTGDLVKPSYLIDTRAKHIEPLYDLMDGRFPDNSFNGVLNALLSLGMINNELQIDDLCDRAFSIAKIQDETKCDERIIYLLCYLRHIENKSVIYQYNERKERDERISALKDIPFLKCLSKPESTNLPWYSYVKGKLLCPSELYPLEYSSVVFTQKALFTIPDNDHDLDIGRLAVYLGIRNKPDVEIVLSHLCCLVTHLENMKPDDNTLQYIDKEAVFSSIYKFLNQQVQTENADLIKSKLEHIRCIWQDNMLLYPRQVLIHWNNLQCLPYLCPLSHENRKIEKFFLLIGVLREPTVAYMINLLSRIKQDFDDKPLENTILHFVDVITEEISHYNTGKKSKNIYLPDEDGILRLATKLSCDSNIKHEWIRNLPVYDEFLSNGGHFIHEIIPRERAIRLGSYPLIEAVMRDFEDENFLDGTEFGQSEELVDRLNGILKKYPADTSIFREFIQNADDAKATKIVFVLDHRVDHPTQRLLNDNDKKEWKELQTSPALCIFNNKPFSEDDIIGICKLGKGGKGETSDTIGRFGIGFNVAYHVTDCPSFISFADENNPKDFCVFDPLQMYCYKATKSRPGRRWNLKKELVEQFPDQFQPFLVDKISEMRVMSDCFDNLNQGFVVFRLPLIRFNPNNYSTASTSSISKRWFSEGKANSVSDLKELLNEFKLSSENMLLFLNNIKNISVFEIEKDGTCCHHFTSTTIVNSGTTDISQCTTVPFNSMCQITISHQEENSDERQTQWIISKRFGFGQDISSNVYSNAQGRGLEAFGGVAAKLDILSEPFDGGMLFCFLPMDIRNHLPVHLNAHFLIDDSRKHLDKLQGLEDWNFTIAEHLLVPAYCELIMSARDKVNGSDASIKWFYSLFPEVEKQKLSEASQLGIESLFYQKVLDANLPILIDARELSDNPSNVNWLTPNDGMFCINNVKLNSKLIRKAEELKKVLIALKMPITCAPHKIFYYLAKISNNKYKAIGSITPSKVLERLKCINLKADGNEDVIRDNCELLLEFCLQDINPGNISKTLKDIPLLLTFDNKLSKDGKLFESSFSRLLPHLHHLFIHSSLEKSLSVSKSLKEGKAIVSLPISFVSEYITLKNVNCPEKLSNFDAELIKNLWEYFQVVNQLQGYLRHESISRLFSHKAIIPTSDGLLYPPILGKCVFRKASHESHVLSLMTKIGYKTLDFSILGLQENLFKFIHSVVGDTIKPCDVIKCFELMPPKIDNDLNFSKEEVDNLITLLSKAEKIPKNVASILKNLPLFQTINNSYIRFSSSNCFFIKPKEVPDSGILKIQENMKQVVLTTPSIHAESFYKKIISKEEYESASKGMISFYLRFIIPNISYLIDEELLTHLMYIKSNIDLYQYTESSPYKPIIDKLKTVSLITKDDGKRHLVSEFCDPEVLFHSVFQEAKLPPKIWCETLSVCFLRLLGLHTAVSTSLWLAKAKEVANEGAHIVQAKPPTQEIIKKCDCLMRSFEELVTTADKKLSNKTVKISSDFIQFLTDASEIPFVYCPTPCNLLNDIETITSHSVKHQYFIHFHDSVCHRSANLTCLVCTVLPDSCSFILSMRNPVFMQTLSIREPINVKAVVGNLIKLTDCLSTVKVFIPTPELNDSVKRIKYVTEAHYSYLDKHLDEKIVKELVDKACILLTTDKSNFQLVKPSQLVSYIPPGLNFRPFCYRTPQELLPHTKLLKMLEVKEDLNPLQYIKMLASIYEEMSKGDIKLQEDEHFLKVCKDAYTALITSLRSNDNPPDIPQDLKIYLPSDSWQLIESKKLVHNDIPWIATRLQGSRTLEYKFLCPPPPDNNGQIQPPNCLRVRLLSKLAVEKLHKNVTMELNRCVEQQLYQQKQHKHNCEAVEVLIDTLTSKEFSEGIDRLYWHKNQANPRTNKKFCIQLKALKELTIKCVIEIKTIIHFNNQIVDDTADTSRLCYFESNNNELIVYITHKVSNFTEVKLFEEVAIEINKHLGHCIGDATNIKAMLECYPNQISMVLNKREISPFNSQETALEPHVSNEIGHEIPQDQVSFTKEDLIIACNYAENERVIYHFVKEGKSIFKIAKVIGCNENSCLTDKCVKLEIGTNKETAKTYLVQIYKQLDTSQRMLLENGSSSRFTSPLTLAPIPTDKNELVALIQNVFAANMNHSHNGSSLTQLSLRLIAHLHYILVKSKKSPDLFEFINKKIFKIMQNFNEKDEEPTIDTLVRKLEDLSINDNEVSDEHQHPPLTHSISPPLTHSISSSLTHSISSSSTNIPSIPLVSPLTHSHFNRPHFTSIRRQANYIPTRSSVTQATTQPSTSNISNAIPSCRIRPPRVNVPITRNNTFYGHAPYSRMTFATSDDHQSPPKPKTSLKDAKIWLHQANADYLAAHYLFESNAHQEEENTLEERMTAEVVSSSLGDSTSEIDHGNDVDTVDENNIGNGNRSIDGDDDDDDDDETKDSNNEEEREGEVNNLDSTCRYPALICFLCHDVVEKSMKALMYAKCGLPTCLVENNHLLALFDEMQKCSDDLITQEVKQVFKECILQVNNYGNKSRYPNYHMPPCVPAAVYTPDDARMCLESGRRILAELKKIDQLIEVFDELPERSFSSLLSTVSHAEEFPDYWEEHEDDEGDVKLILLSPQRDEHYTIAVKFNQTLPNEIIRIERIQNKLLWRKYYDCSRRMMKYSGNLGEKFLFHGTKRNNPELIYKGDSSFDMRFSYDGYWGQGNYFAENASFSNSYAYENGGYRQMLVANVLTGYSYFCPRDDSLRRPPFRSQTSQGVQYRYDSVSGNTGGSVVYITYENDRAYPAYLITYK